MHDCIVILPVGIHMIASAFTVSQYSQLTVSSTQVILIQKFRSKNQEVDQFYSSDLEILFNGKFCASKIQFKIPRSRAVKLILLTSSRAKFFRIQLKNFRFGPYTRSIYLNLFQISLSCSFYNDLSNISARVKTAVKCCSLQNKAVLVLNTETNYHVISIENLF